MNKIWLIGIIGFITFGAWAMLSPMGKDQASALGYECGLNQGKYMAEEGRVWHDDGSQEKDAKIKAKQNKVPAEHMDLFVQRYAEGVAAGQKQVGPEKHYLISYRFVGHEDGLEEEEDLSSGRSPDEAIKGLQQYLVLTESARGNNGRVWMHVSKIVELTEEQYEERNK
jgi:hypothetical protein